MTKNICCTVTAHAKLTQAIADAITDAVTAGGLSKEAIAAVLTRFVELLEEED